MKYCKSCSLYYSDSANWCSNCGAKLDAEALVSHSQRPERPPDVGSPVPWLVFNIILTGVGCIPFGVPGFIAAAKSMRANAYCKYDRVRICNARAKFFFFMGLGLSVTLLVLFGGSLGLGIWKLLLPRVP